LAGAKTLTAGLYARVSTHDQQTLPMQLRTMRAYAKQRGWSIGMEVRDVGSGANVRPEREAMLKAARRRKLDVIMVWRLDRWGRSLLDSQAPSGALAYKNFPFLRAVVVIIYLLLCEPVLSCISIRIVSGWCIPSPSIETS
jgi:hypothetical protein